MTLSVTACLDTLVETVKWWTTATMLAVSMEDVGTVSRDIHAYAIEVSWGQHVLQWMLAMASAVIVATVLMPLVATFLCHCLPGLSGKTCGEVDHCFGVDCNRGRCEIRGSTFFCSCDAGYTGELCINSNTVSCK